MFWHIFDLFALWQYINMHLGAHKNELLGDEEGKGTGGTRDLSPPISANVVNRTCLLLCTIYTIFLNNCLF